MEEYDRRIAVLGVTNEEITSSGRWSQVVYLKSNIPHPALPGLHKVPVDALCDARPGEKLRCHPARLSMRFPYEEDYMGQVHVNGHIMKLHKVVFCNGITFSCKTDEHYTQLMREVISLAQDRLVLPERGKVMRFIKAQFFKKHYTRQCTQWDRRDQNEDILITNETPCRLVFEKAFSEYQIGKLIEERFGLEDLHVGNGFASHDFRMDKRISDAFYAKYPHALRRKDAFTLRHLYTMTYDLVLAKYKHLPK